MEILTDNTENGDAKDKDNSGDIDLAELRKMWTFLGMHMEARGSSRLQRLRLASLRAGGVVRDDNAGAGAAARGRLGAEDARAERLCARATCAID